MITLEEKQAYVSKLLTANQAAELIEPVFMIGLFRRLVMNSELVSVL